MPPISHRTPTIRLRTTAQIEQMVARLACNQAVIWFPAALLERYPPAARTCYRFAAVVWQQNVLLYSLSSDGRMAVLEAVIEQVQA